MTPTGPANPAGPPRYQPHQPSSIDTLQHSDSTQMPRTDQPRTAAFTAPDGKLVQIVPHNWGRCWIGAIVVAGRNEGGEFIARSLDDWNVNVRQFARRYPELKPLEELP